MSKNTSTSTKIQHFGFAVIGDKLRMAEPAATEETALARAAKISKAGTVPTFAVTGASRDEARAAASDYWLGAKIDDSPEAPAAEAPAADVKAAQAEAARRTNKAGFYTVGTKDGETVATPHPVKDGDTALAIGFDADKDSVVAVKAKSRDEAINRYEALAGTLPESRIITAAATRASTPRAPREYKPVEGADTAATWEPIEAKKGIYFVSKSGVLHSQESCRFVKDNTPKMTVKTKDAVATVLASRVDSTVEVPTVDGGTMKPLHLCASCSGKRIVAEAAATEAAA